MRRGRSLLAAALVMLLMSGCAQEKPEPPALIEPVGVQADMAAAYIGEIYQISLYEGSVIPYSEALYFEADGVIEEVYSYPGKAVEAGEALLRLNQTGLKERADALREELEFTERDYALSDAMAELDIEILQIELKQMQEQRADDMEIALKQNEIDQKRAQLRQTQALREPELEAMRGELEKIGLLLDRNVLRAPFSGRIVSAKQPKEGDKAAAYEPVLYLADDKRIRVRSEYIPESTLSAADRLYARIGAQEYELEPIPMDQKEYVSKTLTGEKVYTEYEIVGPDDEALLPEAGAYAAVFLIDGYIPDALLVPSGAVMNDSGGKYVYVDEEGARVRRTVRTGVSTDGLVQIIEGLEEGEAVYVKD